MGTAMSTPPPNNWSWAPLQPQTPEQKEQLKRFAIGAVVGILALAAVVTVKGCGSSLDTTSVAYRDGYAAEPWVEQWNSLGETLAYCTAVVTDPVIATPGASDYPYVYRDLHTRQEWAHGCLDASRATHPGGLVLMDWEK